MDTIIVTLIALWIAFYVLLRFWAWVAWNSELRKPRWWLRRLLGE